MALARRFLGLVAVCITAASAVAAAHAGPRTLTVTTDALGDTEILAPEGEADAFAVLVSDGGGLDETGRARAAALAGKGVAVALIDLPALLSRKDAADGDGCHYVFGDFEAMARVAQRELGMTTWRWPVVVGLGEAGGALAYLALAQAPANTAAGAVSLGFAPRLASRRPLCPGAQTAALADGGFSFLPKPDLPGSWTLIVPAPPGADAAAFVTDPDRVVVAAEGTAAWAAAENAVLAIGAGPSDPLSDLPIVELPADDPSVLVVFISGDGGWRDLDKTIGEWLSAHGVAVVGLDALRYFWSTKTPQQIAADIERIVAHYSLAWQTDAVALLGYSFGADALPLVWPNLSPTTQDETVLVGLLGLARSATLEVTVSGWLGLTPGDAIALAEPLADLPADKVLCIYGASEAAGHETGCTLPALSGAMLVERPGGHHFDGNYLLLAQLIRDRIVSALALYRDGMSLGTPAPEGPAKL